MKFTLQFLLKLTLLCSFSLSIAQTNNVETQKTEFANINYKDKLLLLAPGPKGTPFYALGESICSILNKQTEVTKLRCGLADTAGAEFNIMAITNNVLQAGIIQTDTLIKLSNQDEKVKDSIRNVSILGMAAITLIVQKDIKTVDDLKGKIFNAGALGTGGLINSRAFIEAANLSKTLKSVTFLPVGEITKAFCAGEIDSAMVTTFHPNKVYADMIECGGQLLTIPTDVAVVMQKNIPGSIPVKIDRGTYAKIDYDTLTQGIPVIVITKKDVDQEAIYRFVKLLDTNYSTFYKSVPFVNKQFSTLSEMKELGFPIHDGAIRALK